MKICLIADGRSVHVQRWAAYFADRHDMHVISYDPLTDPVPKAHVYIAGPVTGNLYVDFWPRHRIIRSLVKAIQPDIVHAHFIAKYGFHLPYLGTTVPSVVSAWGDDVLILPGQSRLIRRFTKATLDYADLVYASSRDIERHILDDFQVSSKKVKYLPFGVDSDRFSYRGERPVEDIIQVYSNRGFWPVYNNETLVSGFAQASRKDPRLRLVLKGEGPELVQMKALVRNLGIEGLVTFLPRGTYDEIIADLHRAHIFITTSVSDGTPVSLLEAMSTGLPCIATSVGGIPEWIEDGQNGSLVPPRQPAAVADRILMLAAHPELRRRFGDRARETILTRGDWKHLMQDVEQDYRRLVTA